MRGLFSRRNPALNRASRGVCEALEGRRLLSAQLVDSAVNSEPLPRYLTPAEQDWLRQHPLRQSAARVVSAAPTGPIKPVAEYEPMEGLVISWMAYTSTLGTITKRVT